MDDQAEAHEVRVFCVAHRREVCWLPAPMWWFHGDLSTCLELLGAPSPLFGWISPQGRGR